MVIPESDNPKMSGEETSSGCELGSNYYFAWRFWWVPLR